jgi:CIC family chloride channel protein
LHIGKASFSWREIGYLRKWVPIAILIGIVSGVGALIFDQAIRFFGSLLLGGIAGYYPPTPMGEGALLPTTTFNPFLLVAVTTLGGLISGIIVFGLAPEAEGHGTDSAIDAFHNKKGSIRSRIPIVKLLASAITIGSGGSAGREGPTAQMAAGFGSFLGKLMHLSARDRRIALAVGIGAGIGAIFKAPFGGAILAAEVLYIADFEVDALFPAFIASTVGYSIYGIVNGWTPIFGEVNLGAFQDPINLPLYAVLGIACGLLGIVYVRSFYGIKQVFHKFNIPNYVKPAIGGLLVGVIGVFFPQILGVGYGWLQLLMDGNFLLLPLMLLPIVLVLKIIATSLTVGSGGSGGVFGPGLVIGGTLGAIIWAIFSFFIPNFQVNIAVFVIVGMMAFFGGVGKVPVAVILMASEMTGTLALLVPSMIATAIAYVITGKYTIYKSQVPSRAESPAHRGEYSLPLLEKLHVKDAMTERVITIYPDMPISDAAETMEKNAIRGLPVTTPEGNIVGIVTISDVLQTHPDQRNKKTVETIMSKEVVVTYPNESLSTVLEKLTGNQIGRLPVVNPANEKRLVGIITREDIWRIYRIEHDSRLEQENKLSGTPAEES